jgi:tRNA dimethylallyltransferase
LAIAQAWPVEIISIDSALVYRGMDIGTAKPNADELGQVPHHLIDIRDPLHAYSAAEFAADAARCIREIHARGALPVLVNAVVDALAPLGVRHIDMPLSPPNGWRAIKAARG